MNTVVTALDTDFSDRVAALTARSNAALETALPPAGTPPARLHEAMRYAVLQGGKRLRPLLTYAAGDCLGIALERLDPVAVALELIHAFSLVHDDLPAMDDDDLRRGQPTLHVRFDEATAILAADALQPLAFSVLAADPALEAGQRVALVRLVSEACGSTGMTGGQSLDLSAEGRSLARDELEFMYALKTGALIRAAIAASCVIASDLDDARRAALGHFGDAVGLAFQIRDDILDVEGETGVIGKPAGSDERQQKATWPGLYGVDAAHRRCNELLEAADAALTIFGRNADFLRWLAHYVVARSA